MPGEPTQPEPEEEDEDEEAIAARFTPDELGELRRWKRHAVKVAKGESSRHRFRSQILDGQLVDHIHAVLAPVQRDPEAIDRYFTALIAES